jgi:hypothetical protein
MKTYTHEEMVKLLDEAKADILDSIEEKVMACRAQKLKEFHLISREAVLADILIVRLDNGLPADNPNQRIRNK